MVGSLNATDEIVGAAALVVVVVVAAVVVVVVATVVVVAPVATVVVVATGAGAVAVSFRVEDFAIATWVRFAAVPLASLIVPPLRVNEFAFNPKPSLSTSPATVTYAKSNALVPEPAMYDILPMFAESRNICGTPVTKTGELNCTIT